MWTGEMYGFYSDKPLKEVLTKMLHISKQLDYKHNHFQEENEESFLFYKNKEMLDYHLENGYNTDLNNKGCFSLETKKTKLNGIATLHEFEGESNFAPFDINLIFNRVNYYVLIVPHFIEDSEFSKEIHDSFKKILLS